MNTLAVTSLERSKKYLDIPTLDEAGVIGFFAPAGTPRTVVEVVESAIKEDCVDAEGARAVRSNWSQCATRQC